MNEKQKTLYAKIVAEKANPNPDKKALAKMARQLVALDDEDLEFKGGLDEKPVHGVQPGRRCYRFGKWYD